MLKSFVFSWFRLIQYVGDERWSSVMYQVKQQKIVEFKFDIQSTKLNVICFTMGIYLICFPWPYFMFNFSKIFVIYCKIVKLVDAKIKVMNLVLLIIVEQFNKLAVIKLAVTKLKIPGSCQMITFNFHFRTDSNRTYQSALLSLSLLPIWYFLCRIFYQLMIIY